MVAAFSKLASACLIPGTIWLLVSKPPDNSVYWKTIFFISHLKHVVGTQKNRLNETVLLSTQNPCLN